MDPTGLEPVASRLQSERAAVAPQALIPILSFVDINIDKACIIDTNRTSGKFCQQL